MAIPKKRQNTDTLSPSTRFFHPMDVFKPNRVFDISFEKVGREGHPVLVLDGFYKHPERVRDFVLSQRAAGWKLTDKTRNFKDYYDGRQNIEISFGLELLTNTVARIVKQIFKVDVVIPSQIVTNVFQLIRNQPPDTTAFPHHDITIRTRGKSFNTLIYLNTNDEAIGGTAFYRHLETGREAVPTNPKKCFTFHNRYLTKKGVMEDGVNYWCHYKKFWEPFHLLEMKFNRLVVFPSEIFHGSWQQPNWFKDYPRLTQVFFPKDK